MKPLQEFLKKGPTFTQRVCEKITPIILRSMSQKYRKMWNILIAGQSVQRPILNKSIFFSFLSPIPPTSLSLSFFSLFPFFFSSSPFFSFHYFILFFFPFFFLFPYPFPISLSIPLSLPHSHKPAWNFSCHHISHSIYNYPQLPLQYDGPLVFSIR